MQHLRVGLFVFSIFSIQLILPGLLDAQDVVISEILASNDQFDTDEDGDSSDWIEIHSLLLAPLSLEGYYLTDDPLNLEKWKFPAVDIPGGGFVVVYASGKDRRDPGSELHANFQLDAVGDYLALVEPDGETIADEFTPTYPRQRSDVSYGIGQAQETTALIGNGATGKFWIPTSGVHGLDWTEGVFNDASWTSATLGLGYDLEEGGGGLPTENFASEGTATQSSTLGPFNASLALDNDNANFTHTVSGDRPATWLLTFPDERIIERIVLWNRSSCCGSRLRDITVSILSASNQELWSSELLNPENDLGNGLVNVGPQSLEINLSELNGSAVRGSKIQVVRTPDPDKSGSGGEGNNDESDVLQLAEVEVFGREIISFKGMFRTDVEDELHDEHSSAYIRIPFTTVDPPNFDNLTLRMSYDAGFVAYINGHEVARRNAPNSPNWNSFATEERDDLVVLESESIVITQHQNRILPGNNVLAIHALNGSNSDPDFLIDAELIGSQIVDSARVYFLEPSPGEINNGDSTIGFVSDTEFSVDRGFYDEPFELEITSDTPGAEIRYTTNNSNPTANSGTVYSGPITIDQTTVIRAAAFLDGFEPTNIDTQTYIFLDQVISSPVMRTSITESPVYGPQMKAALTDLPTISIVSPSSFNGNTEARSSVEWIHEDGTSGFQENVGIKNYGGNVTNFPKKNFRVYFRRLYGTSKLKFPLFEGHDRTIPAADQFDKFELRTGSHDMHHRGFYMSNRFTDDSMLDMGNLNPHGRFIHLYINGTYWGQYHLREKWNADMLAEYLGGKDDDYESIRGNRDVISGPWPDPGIAFDGDGSAWNRVKSLASNYHQVKFFVDVPHYIDYMLMYMFGNSESEYRAVGLNGPGLGTGFKFLLNDADGFTRGGGNRTQVNPNNQSHANGPGNIFRDLWFQGHVDFKTLLADRIHKNYFNDGAMTPAKTIPRLEERCAEIERAFFAEAARWNFRTPQSWEDAKNSYINGVLRGRTNTMISQFRSAGFYPSIVAPAFNVHGGLVDEDFTLFIDAPSGEVVYKFDGDDPRLQGGGRAPDALTAGVAETERLLDDESPCKIFVPIDDTLGTSWTSRTFNDSSWLSRTTGIGFERTSGYEDHLGTNDEDLLYQVNATVYIRVPFTVLDPGEVAFMSLLMKYDDGFIAYLNGTPIAMKNDPDNPTWNSSARNSHSDGEAMEFEVINVSQFTHLLVPGNNVLAIHGMNSSSNSSDMLISPAIEISSASSGVAIGPGVTQVKARVQTQTNWSALNEATFVYAPLRISEIHYHPTSPFPNSFIDPDEFEFIEIVNTSTQAIPLANLRLAGGVHFDFTDGAIPTIQPSQAIVVVENQAAFELVFGEGGIPIAGEYQGKLANGGETLRIESFDGIVIQEVTYSDQWWISTDGEGPSLVAVDPFDDTVEDWSQAEHWIPSVVDFGTPGTTEAGEGGLRIPGDANFDSHLDIGDAITLLLLLYRGDTVALPCSGEEESGDTIQEGGNLTLLDFNDDAGVDNSDVVYLLEHIFLDGPSHQLGITCRQIEGCSHQCSR